MPRHRGYTEREETHRVVRLSQGDLKKVHLAD
jgi:hypothetical protein